MLLKGRRRLPKFWTKGCFLLFVCRWKKNDSILIPTCGHSGHTIALYVDVRGDFVIVGDLMKSLQLLVYRDEKIELYAKDFNPAWMTSTIMLNEEVFIGADSSYNMFSLKKFPESASDEERSRLEVGCLILSQENCACGV